MTPLLPNTIFSQSQLSRTVYVISAGVAPVRGTPKRRTTELSVRRGLMRHNVALALAAALAGWMASATPAEAPHCGACAFPAQNICAEQCRLPEVRYRVCYQTVVEEQTQVCHRPVYRTVLKECRSTSYRPVYEQH